MNKKLSIFVSVLSILLAFGAVSCKSADFSDPEVSNAAFKLVYDNYFSLLNLEGAKAYTIKEGDTLSAIAKANYGDDKGYYFPMIMLGSSAVIKDPDYIQPGQELTIPDFEKNLGSTQGKAIMAPYFRDIANIYRNKGNTTVEKELKAIADALGKGLLSVDAK